MRPNWRAPLGSSTDRQAPYRRRVDQVGQVGRLAKPNKCDERTPNLTWEDIQGRKYPPIGRCIYCGSDGGLDGLRDEHIIPYSLGGHAALKEASCRSCEAITSKIELYLGRNIFHEFRSHVRAPSRRKLPSALSANVSVGDREIRREFLAADQPFALMLPIWDLPGIMRGDQPTLDFPVSNVRADGATHAARIEDLGPGDFAKIDGAACCRRLQRSSAEFRCSHTALLAPDSWRGSAWSTV
jgi:hypothetical protein